MRLTVSQDDGSGNPGAVTFSHDYLTSEFSIGTWGTTDPGAMPPAARSVATCGSSGLDNNYWLTFAEFEVIGSTSPLKFSENDNLAVGKPVTTSSPPGYGALLTSGNDGDIHANFNFSSRPVFHSTNYGVGEYWQVDLGAETPLDYLELFARSDGDTTSQFKVSVLSSALAEVGSVIVNNAAPNAMVPDYDHTIDVGGMTGRYIRVATTGDEYLSFTELRAFGAVPEPSSLALMAMGLLGCTWRGRGRR